MVISSFLEVRLNKESAKKIREIAYAVGAFIEGEFTLASGLKSNYYFEGKKLTLSPEGAYWVGKAIFDELAEIDVDAIGGLAIGAIPIVSAVSLVSHLEGRPIPSFIVREERKEHGTKRQIEGHLKEGSRVAIVDDVLTTGGSVSKAIEAVEAVNCKVAKVIVLVDRNEGGSDRLKERYDLTNILNLRPSGQVTISESSVVEEESRTRV